MSLFSKEPVDFLEINISCPNVKEGGIAFGQSAKAAEAITRAVKEKAKLTAVPYNAWANRGENQMRVWMQEE